MKDLEQYCLIIMKCDSKLITYDDVFVNQLLPVNYRSIIMYEFAGFVTLNENHLTIVTDTYKAYCGTSKNVTENIEVDIYGKEGLKAFFDLSEKMDWQIFVKNTNIFHQRG